MQFFFFFVIEFVFLYIKTETQKQDNSNIGVRKLKELEDPQGRNASENLEEDWKKAWMSLHWKK